MKSKKERLLVVLILTPHPRRQRALARVADYGPTERADVGARRRRLRVFLVAFRIYPRTCDTVDNNLKVGGRRYGSHGFPGSL